MPIPDVRNLHRQHIDLTHIRPVDEGIIGEDTELLWIFMSCECLNWMRNQSPSVLAKDRWLVKEVYESLCRLDELSLVLGCYGKYMAAKEMTVRYRQLLGRFPEGRIEYGKVDNNEMAYFIQDSNVVFILYRTILGDTGPPPGGYGFERKRTIKTTTIITKEKKACQHSAWYLR